MSSDQREQRREYARGSLSRQDLHDDPLVQLQRWLDDALAAQLTDATAMSLATADGDGHPSVRIVLLKELSAAGLLFFTDYDSDKGRDIAANNRVECMFYWREFERQVRVSGTAAQVERAVSDSYFQSRPLASQVSAAASLQSQTIASRAELEARAAGIQQQSVDGHIPTPAHWGGYRVSPLSFEFWQGRQNRLHDRFVYNPSDTGWQIQRLQP